MNATKAPSPVEATPSTPATAPTVLALASLAPTTFAELVEFARLAARSQLVPQDYRNHPEDILLAVQLGSEVGLRPMQSLQNIAVINGRPAVWGDALPGLCKASPVYQDLIESFEREDEPDFLVAVCTAKRHGSTPVTARFAVIDAKRAGLWTKPGPWQTYPRRMLQMRARSFALRDAFPDVLKGLISVEEALDLPPVRRTNGPTIDATPEPPSMPAPPPPRRSFINSPPARAPPPSARARSGWMPGPSWCAAARSRGHWTNFKPPARRTRRTSPPSRLSIPPPPPHSSRSLIARCQSLGKMREQPSGRAHLRTPPTEPDRRRSCSSRPWALDDIQRRSTIT